MHEAGRLGQSHSVAERSLCVWRQQTLHRYAEDAGDAHEVAELGVCRSTLDALDRGPVDAGPLRQSLLCQVLLKACHSDAVTQGYLSFTNPLILITWHQPRSAQQDQLVSSRKEASCDQCRSVGRSAHPLGRPAVVHGGLPTQDVSGTAPWTSPPYGYPAQRPPIRYRGSGDASFALSPAAMNEVSGSQMGVDLAHRNDLRRLESSGTDRRRRGFCRSRYVRTSDQVTSNR